MGKTLLFYIIRYTFIYITDPHSTHSAHSRLHPETYYTLHSTLYTPQSTIRSPDPSLGLYTPDTILIAHSHSTLHILHSHSTLHTHTPRLICVTQSPYSFRVQSRPHISSIRRWAQHLSAIDPPGAPFGDLRLREQMIVRYVCNGGYDRVIIIYVHIYIYNGIYVEGISADH